MSDITPHLLLPYILASQAQKHVTHNEALRLLDAMVQLSVLDRNLTAPPASPVDGDRYIVASGATGLWAGWDLNVAFWIDGVWLRLVPRPGWLAWIAAEQAFVVWNGSSWDLVGEPVDVSDAVFSLVNDADPTKRALFSLSGISTGTTRTFTLPNTSSELAILAGTQTFSGNKTFSGTLTASGTVTVSAASASIGTATTTATYGMGTGATTTGVTKTVNLGTGGASGSTTVVNIGSATAGAGGTTVVNTPTVTFANAVTQVGMPQANLTAQLLGLGGATADSFNRLSMNTPAVLLNNAGAGIEATVNKAAAGNDAAFAFKTGFSARALIGLLGNDDFSFKVSPDGSAFYEALVIEASTGVPRFPRGLGGTGSNAGRMGGQVMAFSAERSGAFNIGAGFAHGNGSNISAGVAMPFPGRVLAASLSLVNTVAGYYEVQLAVDRVANPAFAVGVTAAGGGVVEASSVDFSSAPLAFAAGQSINGIVSASAASTTVGVFSVFYLFD